MSKHIAKRMPRSFRKGHSGNLACRHRDVSCCPQCAAEHDEIIEVYGQHFWVSDETERKELRDAIMEEKK